MLANAEALTDDDLFSRLQHLASQEREATVELIAHLAALDTRNALLAKGYGSLFAYCTDALRFSEDAAYSRILAARLARKFPVILERLNDGSVSLTAVRLLAAHFTPNNHRELLAEASGKSRRQIEALVARVAPQPDVAASVRKLPTPAQPAAALLRQQAPSEQPAPAQPAGASPGRPAAGFAEQSSSPQPVVASLVSAHRPVVSQLAPERFRIQFTVGRDTYDRLRRVRELLCREIPDGDPGVIFDHALALLLEAVERKKVAATSKPQPHASSRPKTVDAHRPAFASRHLPHEVTRAVWRRDGSRCAFVARDGRRCTERRYLELHHVRPYAMGGEATVENISLRCRRHNVYEAELAFGRCDPWVVREPPQAYPDQADGRLPSVTCSGTGWWFAIDRPVAG
jgi:hypothetical protein